MYGYVGNSPVAAVDPSGLLRMGPGTSISTSLCKAACKRLLPKGSGQVVLCEAFCATFNGTTCGALWAYCEHVGRHPGTRNKKLLELCVLVHNAECGPDPDSKPIGGLCRASGNGFAVYRRQQYAHLDGTTLACMGPS